MAASRTSRSPIPTGTMRGICWTRSHRSGRNAIVAPWYRAIGAYFAEHDNLADAFRHFEQAHAIVPDDPGVLFGEACFQETLGSPAIQNFARITTLPNGFTLLGVSSSETHFRRAETLLTRALSARPDFVDARLRLGRVPAARRQHEESLPHLARVIDETHDPVLTYYAHLFAGDASLALDRPPTLAPRMNARLRPIQTRKLHTLASPPHSAPPAIGPERSTPPCAPSPSRRKRATATTTPWLQDLQRRCRQRRAASARTARAIHDPAK